MRLRRRGMVVGVVAICSSACSGEPATPFDPAAEAESPIVNGSSDTTHQAVVAVFSGGGKCTGTIIKVSGNTGWVLTAAHCLGSPPDEVRQGNNHNNPDAVYPATAYAVHPLWDGCGYDFGIVQFSGANASTPVIPAISEAEDTLSAGSQLDIVGYGQTENGPTASRRHKVLPIFQLSDLKIIFDQSGGGMCFGDSGGPALATVGGQERVAGVSAAVSDPNCLAYGISSRVSSVVDTFINPVINGSNPAAATCDECSEYATQCGVCEGAVDTCLNDAQCSDFVECLQGCATNFCADKCVTDNPFGWDKYQAIDDCICTQGCASECASEGFCAPPPPCGFTSSNMSCQQCLDAQCCAQGNACADAPQCAICYGQGNPPASCDTEPLAIAFNDCLAANCSDECNISTGSGGGGSGGEGGAGSGGGSSSGGSGPSATGAGGGETGAAGPTGTGTGESATSGGSGDQKTNEPRTVGGCSTSRSSTPGAVAALLALAACLMATRRRRFE